MKIAIIIRRLNVSGGAQRQVLSLAVELAKMGHKIKVYTFDYSKECLPELAGSLEVVSLPANLKKRTSGVFGFINESKMAKRLAKMIDADTDILHPHDNVAHHVAYFFKKNIKNIPSVWYMNEFPTMRWPMELLSEVEDPNFHNIPGKPLWMKKLMIMMKTFYDNFFIRRQDSIVVLDDFHKRMLKRYSGMDGIVVHSGIDLDGFTYTERTPIKRGEKIVLLSSGIFSSYRRYEDLLNAVSILCKKGYDIHLAILGKYDSDKKYFEVLKDLAEKLGIKDRAVFFGPYTDEELRDFLKKSYIFIFPHLQSCSLSVYEAIFSGLPSIVTPLLGTYETLVDGKDVIFADAKNPADLAEKIEKLIKNPDLYMSLSKQGAETIKNNFSWEKYARGIVLVFEKVMRRKW